MASFKITRANGEVYTVLCDDEDLERIQAVGAWRILPAGRSVYAQHGTDPITFLHRFVMGDPPAPACVRVLDHNGLNVQKANLSIGTKGDAIRGRRVGKNSTTGERGVYRTRCGRFGVRVRMYGEERTGGWHETIEAAAAARDRLVAQMAAGKALDSAARGQGAAKRRKAA